jgi:hypothetical protein
MILLSTKDSFWSIGHRLDEGRDDSLEFMIYIQFELS